MGKGGARAAGALNCAHVSPERTGFYSPFEPASESFVRCYQKQFACTPSNIRRDRAMEARRQAQERANHRGDDW